MKEIWKDIEDWEGLYQVSNFGRVKSLNYRKTGMSNYLIPRNSYIYDTVCLCNRGHHKYALIHRLVAEAFIPNPKNKAQVNHKDGDKHNNYVGNLEWVSPKENIIHSIKTLKNSPGDWSRKPVRCIETGKIFGSQTEAASYYHTSQGAIGNAARKNRPSAGGFHWEFV